MYCPNCGSEAPREQKFCRSCGFGLGNVAQLIAKQAHDENIDSASDPKEGPSKSFRQVWFLFFTVMFLTFCVFFIAPGGGKDFFGVIFLLLLLTMLPFGIYTIFERKRPGRQQSPQSAYSTNAPTTQKLQPPPENEMNASVTEQTTANLAERNER